MKSPATSVAPGRRFTPAFLSAFGVVLVLCFALYRREAGQVERQLRDREVIRLGVLAQLLQSNLAVAANDLRVLSAGDGLRAFLASSAPADLDRATERAASFSRLHPEYESLRYVDQDGREQLHIDRGGSVRAGPPVPVDLGRALTSSANTASWSPGRVLVVESTVDTAGRQTGNTVASVLRLATPVFDPAGRSRGFYALDYPEVELLSRLQQSSPLLRRQLRLLNAGGFWIDRPNEPSPPGAPAPGAAPAILAHTDPAFWAQLSQQSEGQERHHGGLFTWRRLRPHEFVGNAAGSTFGGGAFLVLGSEISREAWADYFTGLRTIFAIVTPGLLLLAGTSAWLYRSHRQAMQSLRDSEENLAVTLQSIGDGVLATDAAGNVTRMNRVAEQLTGWPFAAAAGRPVAEVFEIINEDTRQPAVVPVNDVLATGKIHGLANHTLLRARNGSEKSIADSAAPIRDRGGRIIGVVLVFRDVTADREAENLQAHFAAIVASSEDAILGKSLDGHITSWNAAAARMFGYSVAEAVGQPISLIVPAERADEESRILAGIAEGGAFAHVDTVRRRRDGSPIDVSVTISPIRNREGRVIGVSSIARDTGRQRQAAEMLRKSANEIRDLYNHAPCGYHSLDAQGLIIAMNDTELNWLGYRREKVVGRMRLPDLLAPESQAVFQASFPKFKHEGALHGLELRMVRRDGTTFHTLLNATAVYDLQGGFVSSRSSVFDITARKEAEAELDRFFSLSLDFLCISSDDGYFKRVSPAVTEMLGWSVEEFLAQPYLDLVHPDDLEATVREVERQVIGGEKVLQFENRYRHKDGSWRVLSWKSMPQPGGLMYATARDVTEHHRQQEAIRLLNTNLQRHAAQLEVANKELETFSYSVSHDLRAPLRHIQGYVEMLNHEAGTQLSEKGRRFLHTISSAAREMGTLIDDLLAFSRMRRTEFHESVVDLDRLVADVHRDLGPSCAGRNIHWQIAPLPAVQGDPAMLRQVWANLLDNAVKYTRRRDPAEIAIGCAAPEDGHLVFFVRDNGAGFDMRYADKLFGVFQRLHRAEDFEGTGIGLATVQRIVARHGGRIWAEARPDAGATFSFTLRPATRTSLPP